MKIKKILRKRALRYAPYVEPSPLRHALVRHKVYALRTPVGADGLSYRVDEMFALKCIFFHLPKTGGMAVSEALFGNHAAGHIDVATARLIFGAWRLRTFFKFGFVRNPWDRLVSAYHYLRKGHPDSKIVDIVKATPTFADFVKTSLRQPLVAADIHIRPQSSFVVNRQGRLVLDFVGRFERLAPDFEAVCRRLGVERTLSQRNQSAHRGYRDYYDAESREIVGEFYCRDAELFGYRFDEPDEHGAKV